MKKLIKKLLREGLFEEEFKYTDLDSTNQDDIYNVFKQSYEKHTGASWDKSKFQGRAKNWLFFGDETGFITVRPQRSGFYKLVGVAGNMKGILKGMNELRSKNYPIWGMVSADLRGLAEKQGLKTPPAFLIKLLLRFIPKSIFGGVDFDINSDGSITLKYDDVGDAKKYFIANDEYFKKLKSDILPTIKDKMPNIPSAVKLGLSKFLGENIEPYELINEDITSGRAIVYHRTGKNGESPVKGVASDGYRVGSGAMYGIGVYTTYTLESQLKDNMAGTYGGIIIESKVKSLNNFLIFDYDIAKKVYGNKNYTLDKQLRIILGGKFDKYRDDNDLKTLIEKIPVVKLTSDVANYFVETYKDILTNISGIVFTGRNDGNVLICYDRQNIEPIRYTMDEGKTWKNILDKNIYKRLKGYDPEETGKTGLAHTLNKIELGNISDLTNDEINILLNNKEAISKLRPNDMFNLLKNSKEPEKVYDMLGQKGKELISHLTDNGIEYLLEHPKEPDKVINILLSNNELISNLESDSIKILLQYSKEPEKVYNILLSNNELISNLDYSKIVALINYSKEPEKVINILLSNEKLISININFSSIFYLLENSKEPEKVMNALGDKGREFISRLNSNGIHNLLANSKEPERVINILGDKGREYISKLDSYNINNLLEHSKEPDKVINILLSNEKLILRLNSGGIYSLLEYSPEREKVINILLSNKEFISKLEPGGIYYLLRYSKEPEKVMNILGDKGREAISNLDSNGIYSLLGYSPEREKVMNILLSNEQFISNLDSDGIEHLLDYSEESDKVKDLLRKYGHDV